MNTLGGLRRVVRPLSVTLAAGLLIGSTAGNAAASEVTDTSDLLQVIVQESSPLTDDAERAVVALGGRVEAPLPIVRGFAASIPSAQLSALSAVPGVAHVTPDEIVTVQSETTSANTSTTPTTQLPSVYKASIKADKVQASGINGAGTVVALVDTGVSPVADLQGRILQVTTPSGSKVDCVDLSGDNSCKDNYGHGTFIAGLIAGTGASSNGEHRGVAPGAQIISLKIAGEDGSAPVSKILLAIQWVTENKDAYGIDVLNLSLGTDSKNSYKHDPFNYAVEQAWFKGVTVVVSAGNLGPEGRTISKPADDPFVITVGATDDLGTKNISDDILPNYTSRGPTADGLTKPDVVTPGSRLVSLRAPGSAIEKQFPAGVDNTYRRGSGTSMSTGVVSGAVALMLQKNPTMTPDEVKYALAASARKVASNDAQEVGAGSIDASAAVFAPAAGKANVGVTPSTGSGPLSLSMGTVKTVAKNPLSLADPNGGSWYGGSWYGGSWYGGSWYGGSWYGSSWYGGSWYGGSWYGGSWYGQPNGGSWYGGSWYGGSWYGAWS